MNEFSVRDYEQGVRDGKHEAAAEIEEQRKKLALVFDEVSRLRAALQTISNMTDYGTETATYRMTGVIHNANVIARAALTATPAPKEE